MTDPYQAWNWRVEDSWLTIYSPALLVGLTIVAIVYLADLTHRIVWWFRIRKSRKQHKGEL